MRTMHLFAGGGGGMYADLILGHTPVVAVEWDKYCCDVLRRRKDEGWWPEAEIIEGDVSSFSGERYAGEVDCIHAGFPCQDLSFAGERKGLEGNRSILYEEALRIFGEVRPHYLFLENVPGIFTANGGEAFNRVMSDLASLGLDTRWACLRASEVGANHHRDRWWCLAYADGKRCEQLSPTESIQKEHNTAELCGSGGTGWWETEPNVGRVDNGVAQRGNRLKMLGNGQVPLQAAAAWVMLGGPVEWE